MKHAVVALLALYITSATAQQTELRIWLMPGDCAAFPVQLAQGDQTFQLVRSRDSPIRVSGIMTGCLHSTEAGLCSQVADASQAACALAVASDTSQLEGELLAVPAGTEGIVYALNPSANPVLVDLLAVIQTSSQSHAASATATGTYRRALLRSMHTAADDSSAVATQALQRRPRRALLDSSSPATTDVLSSNNSTGSGSTPTSSPTSGSGPATVNVLAESPNGSSSGTPTPTSSSTDSGNLIDRAVNHFDDPTVRKWVKIAIIVLIVLVCLSILSCLFCVLRCICWPCCCAARGFK